MSKNLKMYIVAVVLLGGVYFVVDRKSDFFNTKEEFPVSTTTQNGIITNGEGYTIEELPNIEDIPVPDLNRKIVFGDATLDNNIKKLITENVTKLQAELKDDNTKADKWLELARYFKIAGDYEGARIIWQYISDVIPTDYVSLGNLGDLYSYYFKDKTKGEMYYKKAISNASTQVYLYIQLAGVYKDVFLDTNKAKEILDQGLKRLPGNKDLLQAKNNL